MKKVLTVFLLWIYVAGFVLIPGLHTAGFVFPHSQTFYQTEAQAKSSSADESVTSCTRIAPVFIGECALCHLAKTFLETPESEPCVNMIFEKIMYSGHCLDALILARSENNSSRAPPAA